MSMLPAHEELLLKCEMNFDEIVELLKRNLGDLHQSSMAVNVARTNLLKNDADDEGSDSILRRCLDLSCKLWLHDWIKRRHLLALFSEVDQDLRNAQVLVEHYRRL